MLDKLGCQVLFDFTDIIDAVEFVREKGFKCVEINQTNPAFFPEKYSPQQRKKLKDSNFPILFHAPESLSLFNLHKNVLNEILARIYEVIDFAGEIGAKGVTLHLGTAFTISIDGKAVPIQGILTSEYKNTLEYALKQLIEYAKGKVKLCIENTVSFRYDISQQLLKELLAENLWLTWDLGHTNRKGNKIIDEKFFGEFVNKVNTVHIHDNNGIEDEHKVPGTGILDFERYFKILKPVKPYLILEVRPINKAMEALESITPILKKI
ncbi:MAG: sugar phosphate isomerase/epimerase [bacterium]